MDRQTAIPHLIAVADTYLGRFDGPGIAEVRSGIARWKNGPLQDVVPGRIDAVRHVDTALAWMKDDGETALVEAIEAAMPFLAWGAYDPYPREEIGDKYATGHAATILIGQHGHVGADDFDLGLFVFSPDTLYRDHCHAAPELYAPLTGPHGWRFASGAPLDWRPAHRPVWNEAWAQHAFKSGNNPFFCLYAWTRDVAIPARMILEPDWAELEL
jgi:hypothetical protein